MSFYFISDIHVKEPNDFGCLLLKDFFAKSNAKEGDEIFLVGDIFDLMIGDHVEYLSLYSDFFNQLKVSASKGVKIHFFEGNHDFHLRKLFKRFCKLNNVSEDLIRIYQGPLFTEISGKKIHVSHGDDIEIDNPSYKAYKRVVNNPFMKFVANYIMPFSLLNFIGTRASNKSRNRNQKKYEIRDDKNVMEKFRESFRREIKRRPVDILVCGHSHVKDDYTFEEARYLNVGYARLEKTFLKISDDGQIDFVNLA